MELTDERLANLEVCIVGGGNAAQALAALIPFKGVKTTMWASFQDEAERLNKGIAEQGHMKAIFAPHNDPAGEVTGKPRLISKDAKDVVPTADVLIMPLPSFAYPSVLEALKPHLRKGQFIGVTPGQGGFDWTARKILGEVANDVTFFAIMPMPFNCRIKEFGKLVEVQTLKRRYRVGAVPEARVGDSIKIVERLFGPAASVGHFLSCTLYPINAIIHPQRLYRLLRDWKPGQSLPENPLFYESMDDESTALMDAVNKELIATGEAVREKCGLDVQVPHIFQFLGFVYQEAKADSLTSLFNKNDAYKGFRCPFKQEGEGWVPDFQNRYFTEDIPLGLCIYKGIADIVGVPTPQMDEVICWMQGHMGKEYVKDGKLQGAHVNETTAPQAFGITTLHQLKNGQA
mmetsp:Transcript_46123/g.116126  ORF Transcript_46123/g.116126 Transcript_46123/m.116126 type:complete len:402 (-) Transcript_46123:233-1438(-)